MKADAIVVAFQSSSIIAACVQSLRSDPAIDRIVVVNNSPDTTTGEIVSRYPGTLYLQQVENVGFGRAVNKARPFITREFVVLANPDAVQTETTTSEAIGFLKAHAPVGVLGPRMVKSDGSLYRNSQRDISLWRIATQALMDHYTRSSSILSAVKLDGSFGERRSAREHGVPHVTEYVIGSFLVCRRAALDDVGWFDESIFLFGEDQDLCRRIRHAGWEIWYAPIGRVTHLGGHSWRQLSDKGRNHFRKARYRELLHSRGPLQADVYSHLSRLYSKISGHQPVFTIRTEGTELSTSSHE